MAADSRVTDNGVVYDTDKIFEVGGSIIGMAGDVADTTRFLRWFAAGAPEEAPDFGKESGFSALVLSPTGLHYYAGCCKPDPIHGDFYAIGAGAMAAMAVMTLGHTPELAVATACKVNPDSGGPVKVLSLPTPSLGTKYRKRRPKI